jgi:hypothetical protein
MVLNTTIREKELFSQHQCKQLRFLQQVLAHLQQHNLFMDSLTILEQNIRQRYLLAVVAVGAVLAVHAALAIVTVGAVLAVGAILARIGAVLASVHFYT